MFCLVDLSLSFSLSPRCCWKTWNGQAIEWVKTWSNNFYIYSFFFAVFWNTLTVHLSLTFANDNKPHERCRKKWDSVFVKRFMIVRLLKYFFWIQNSQMLTTLLKILQNGCEWTHSREVHNNIFFDTNEKEFFDIHYVAVTFVHLLIAC